MNIFNLFKKMSFTQGLMLGLFLSSSLSYAVVTFSSFTSGTAISSSAMNTNFSNIKTKLDQLDIGFTGSISSDLVVTCLGTGSYPSYPVDYIPITMNPDYNDGNFNGSYYLIPETGLYRLYLDAPSDDGMGYNSYMEISTNGGSTWTMETATTKKLLKDTKIRVATGCGTMAGIDSTINSAKFVFAIKKF